MVSSAALAAVGPLLPHCRKIPLAIQPRSLPFFHLDIASEKRSNVDFKGADLTGASLEDAGLDGADLSDAKLISSYLSATVQDAAKISGADFSEAVSPF